MKEELKKVIDETISHNTFLNKNDLFEAIEKSYEIGLQDGQKKYDSLKRSFEDLLLLIEDSDFLKKETISSLKSRAGLV